MKNKNWIILSLGGSLVFPEDEIDVAFLRKIKAFILNWQKKGKKFVIFVGGGKLARYYQKFARKLGLKDENLLDCFGIYSTYLNALLVKSLFGDLAFQDIIKNPTKKVVTSRKIIIGAGWKPGRSTDYDAVLFAKSNKLKEVINLTDVDYVYDKDPDKFKDAKPFSKMSFPQFLKLGTRKWKAGLNFPFDPEATKLAQKEKIKAIIVNGKDFRNLDNLLKGRKFKGTVIF
jgi:uridylate kinase